ncbi:MAG TPA: IS1595 family transposase [Burkholderiales bacterium]|nr:IS1595 family transposase [Burkholderiales bacterium]
MSILSQPYFHNEAAAYQFVESRLWPSGPVCPHCGGVDRISPMRGNSTRMGVYKCYDCRKPFTVKIGTIFESSHIKMRLWLQAIFLIASSKKGISSNQLHRTLGITLKSAWFMSHRIREAMKDGSADPLGGEGSTVEVDETFVGRKEGRKKAKAGYAHKNAVFSLVERSGKVRSFHVADVTAETLKPIIKKQMSEKSKLMTDDAGQYRILGKVSETHETVAHMHKEYVRGEVHTNTVEGFFSIFKRGIYGTYQHVSEHHLQRYATEFDFRYNNRQALGVEDAERAENLLRGAKGRRLMYKTPHQ